MTKKITLEDIKQLCSDAQHECKKQWRYDTGNRGGFMVCRPRAISCLVKNPEPDGRVRGVFEGEEYPWDGTLEDLRRAMKKASEDGTVVKMEITGAYNYALSLRGIQDGDYDPMVAEWSVEVPLEIFKN